MNHRTLTKSAFLCALFYLVTQLSSWAAQTVTLALSPCQTNILAGVATTVSSTVTVTIAGGSTAVSLAVSGQPSGVTAGLGTTSFTASGTTTLTITLSSGVTPGLYPITITGSGGASGTTSFGLMVGNNSIWNGASGTDTNWSDNANWTVAPVAGGTNYLAESGTVAANGSISNVVDTTTTLNTLRLANSINYQNTLLADGVTLNVTNLIMGTWGDAGVATPTATISGSGGSTLNLSSGGILVLNQGSPISASGQRATLILSNLDNFNANISRIGLGTTTLPNPVNAAQREAGILYLARTNNITITYTDTLANYQSSGKTNAIEMSHNPGNNAGTVSYLYLGLTNVINVDSLGIGLDKSGNNSTPAGASVLFNPSFAGQSPVAWFYGVGGPGSRVTWWSVGDGNASSSSSNGGRGTNDFTQGTINAFINVLSLGRECNAVNTGWAGPHSGVFSFNAGTVDVNTVYAGNEAFNQPSSMPGCAGTLNVGGPAALLKVNNALVLGQTTVTYAPGPGGRGTNAFRTTGVLNVLNGGAVWANTVSVGATSVTNTISLSSATLIVSNTIATNASGLFVFNLTNSTLGLTVPTNGSLRGLVQTLNTVGTTNTIQLDSNPVFLSSYPQQFALIKYTTWTGSNVFGFTNLPAWASGATLVSNGVNKSLDLLLPADPRPIFTSQPSAYSGAPGDNVTSSFAVTISAGSVTPLGYQWYFVTNNVTNSLTDGSGPSGSSTLTGSTTANLQIANAQPGDNGNYFVVVSNQYGTNASSQALLTISSSAIAPTVSGPATVTATNGITTVIGNTVSGAPVPDLYWQYNGVPLTDGVGPSGSSTISGTSGSTLTIISPQYPGDQGTYSLIASNSAGMATNNTVLAVIVPPYISTQPTKLVVTSGHSASFTVAATGVPTPNYQWNKNGLPISSLVNSTATNATFSISSASASDIASYSCTIVNQAGGTNTVSVSLTVNSATLAAASLAPANGQTGVCYDTPLYLTFNAAPTLRTAGTIKIYNVTNSSTPVDTLDMSLNTSPVAPYAVNIQPRNIGGNTFSTMPVIITGNIAAIYPHLGVLTSNQTYYVTIDDGVFTDAGGAYYPGITATNVWKFSTKVGGPANPTDLVVAADGSGDFVTVQGAVDSVPANNTTPTRVNIRNGTYEEIVNINAKHNLDLRGQSRSGAIVGYPNNNNANPGAPLRSCFVLNGNDCTLENLTLTNMTPLGGSQAEAVDVEGSRAIFLNMELDSYQDTFLVHSAGKLVYFQDSLIQGQTDFNWGYGTVYYTNCELRCLVSGGHVTQPRSPYTTNGFGFINCRITQGYAGSSAFDLGRTISTPTSPSEVLFYNCLMADVVPGYASDAGTNMADFACSNLTASAAKTLAFSTHPPITDPFVIAIQSASTWLYGWQPQAALYLISQSGNQTVTNGQSAAFTVNVTAIPAPTYQWFKNGTNLPGATSATLNIGSAQRSDAGTYYVVASSGSGSVTSSVVTLTYNNTAPVAQNFTLGAVVGQSITTQIIGGQFAPSDADNDALTVTAVAGATNGIVSTDGTSVTYTATNGPVDSFTYTVSDGFGGTAIGAVSVDINSNPQGYNLLTASSQGNGVNVLTFSGIPTDKYALDLATNLLPPINWVPQATNVAGSDGSLSFTNVSLVPQSFYRTRQLP